MGGWRSPPHNILIRREKSISSFYLIKNAIIQNYFFISTPLDIERLELIIGMHKRFPIRGVYGSLH